MASWLRTVDSTVFKSVRRVLFAAALVLLWSGPALADFHICNNSGSRVGVAIGYKDADGQWTTEGWWNLSARSCETLLKGALIARYYYLYAIDYDRGGEWSGRSFMCTQEKTFTIKGIEDCLKRGFERTGSPLTAPCPWPASSASSPDWSSGFPPSVAAAVPPASTGAAAGGSSEPHAASSTPTRRSASGRRISRVAMTSPGRRGRGGGCGTPTARPGGRCS